LAGAETAARANIHAISKAFGIPLIGLKTSVTQQNARNVKIHNMLWFEKIGPLQIVLAGLFGFR